MPPPVPRINPHSQRLTQESITSHANPVARSPEIGSGTSNSKVCHYCIFSIKLLRLFYQKNLFPLTGYSSDASSSPSY